jgi:hypothetical protein
VAGPSLDSRLNICRHQALNQAQYENEFFEKNPRIPDRYGNICSLIGCHNFWANGQSA